MKLQLAKTCFRIFRFGQVTFTDTNHKVLCFDRGQCPIFVHTILRRPFLETTGKARSDSLQAHGQSMETAKDTTNRSL